MTSKELRQKYLDFFKSKGHAILPSAPLIPENDPTVLFTTAGMHPLVPYLLGEKHPQGRKLASVQKCVRTSDISEVGNDWHLTFFEMLGNWSLGDYWKARSIDLSWEFLTSKKWLALDPGLLAASVFKGDDDAPLDQEAYDLWLKKLPKDRIAKLDKNENWWGPAGKTGPCGPDTEIFFWSGGPERVPKEFDPSDGRWVEIWNNVFMEYNKTDKGRYEPLKQKNVDTGMGLERTVAVLSGKNNIYEIDTFQGIITEVNRQIENVDKKDLRIIVDHLRAAVFMAADGIVPSNLEQGYVLRRLIRTAIVKGIKEVDKVAEIVIDNYSDVYDELKTKSKEILKNFREEQSKFSQTLDKALNEYKKLGAEKQISGQEAFILFSTYGLPFEVIQSLAKDDGFKVDEKGFKQELKKHQNLSRTATEGKFKSGLADDSEAVKKLHTATHLLHQALREVLGEEIKQKGSNITAERLRFDFTFSRKMTEEEIKRVERIVNEKIKAGLEIKCEEMDPEIAQEQGAIGLFGHKYGDKVKVYSAGDFSKEICAGPHVSNTKELGSFKIKKEESSSSGVRRIKGVLE